MMKFSFSWFLIFPLILLGQKQTPIKEALVSLQKAKEDSSKVNLLNKIGLYYNDSDARKAFQYSKKALQLAEKLNWEEGVAKANFTLGTIHNTNFNYDKALVYFNQSLSSSNQKFISKTYQSLGSVYIYKSNFSKALEYYFKALKIEESYKDKEGIAKISANIGSIYFGIHDYSKALQFFTKSVKAYEGIDDQLDLAIVTRNMAGVYNSLNQPQKALLYYEKANALSKKLNNTALQARILSDIALVYYNLEDYDNAINNCNLSLKAIDDGTEDKQTIAFNYGVLGDSFIGKAKANHNNIILLDSAVSNLNRAVQLHKQFNSSRDLAYDYSSITEVYKLKGDYKNALASYETAMVYEDSVYNFDNKETIKNLEDKRAIELRDREIKINNLELEAKEKQKWLLIIGLALLGIIGGLLFYQNQNRKKTNEKLQLLNTDLDEKNHALDQANKTNARFFAILNHDLRSPVYNLIHFLHLQKENPELLDEAMKTSIQTKTMTSAENLLQSMEDLLLWSKSQMENFKPQPKDVKVASLFEDIGNHFSSEETIKIRFESPDDIHLKTDENYLKTILRNLTGNAIKALQEVENPTIIWKSWQEKNQVYLSITDNGAGAGKEQFKALYDDKEVVGIKSGLGLHLIRDLAKAIDCQITVDSTIGVGTTFTLKL